ncbi:MAG: T9SS type A sorting domain-containing protein [FCB group bacterium]|nr:T9SS type A sorting domain-containing protein [FCB group bacterium]MBL7028446.1 T9SS type A sorting domain-containing protein [Candidatus Neomarinimicrobiota bacterium]MBL7122360.1 T9SS type A sorting domain-containing protein [Candidatus Neomarinimicrobiota bacterium]
MNFKTQGMQILITAFLSTGLIFAQGMGGGGHHGGGPGGPGAGGWGPGDSTGCDSTGGGHHGGGWGPGDSTWHDSLGHGGHHGPGHGGPGHGGPGHGFGHGDSLSLDSIFVSGVISTLPDTMDFNGHVRIHVSYFLDVDGDLIADYRLVHLRGLQHADSNFVLPVHGNLVELSGLLFPSDEILDRIAVLSLSIIDEDGLFGTLGVVDPASTGMHFGLQSRHYPNPFNPSTSIEFSIESTGHVSLKVYDITGVEVAQLMDGTYAAGLHTIQFNPGTLSAGTYLYVIESNGMREVKRVAYLK